MKGSDLIQIATSVYGIRWFEETAQEIGISEAELSALTKADVLPAAIQYAMRVIATKYMVRVESMQVNANVRDALLNGTAADKEQAAYMAGIVTGMTVILKAIHGEPEELKELAANLQLHEVNVGDL